jgi:hypothetical protein
MSKSLALRNGDLQVGSGRAYETVTGREKLRQDLSLWLLERIGTDPMTPTYGSRLDGGLIDGREIPSYIGQLGTTQNLNLIRMEILDLLTSYQNMQLDKVRRETLLYRGRNTLEADEVIDSIDSVEVTQVGTTILARIILTTLGETSLKLTLPIATEA